MLVLGLSRNGWEINMKRARREIIRILLILTIQILISILLSYLIDEKWNFKNLFWNYGFIIFWSSYIVVIISIGIAKKSKNFMLKMNLFML